MLFIRYNWDFMERKIAMDWELVLNIAMGVCLYNFIDASVRLVLIKIEERKYKTPL